MLHIAKILFAIYFNAILFGVGLRISATSDITADHAHPEIICDRTIVTFLIGYEFGCLTLPTHRASKLAKKNSKHIIDINFLNFISFL